jgi:hypothetical protein
MYIKNKRDNCKIKICSPFILSCKLKDLNFAIAYFSYTQRYQPLNHFSKQLLLLLNNLHILLKTFWDKEVL